ncbi:MAG TPA: FHA domain-containing protein, partial [Blastocatellia bacterium]|nr:FHA domain-containing protein [Blastocatellia bacterium]
RALEDHYAYLQTRPDTKTSRPSRPTPWASQGGGGAYGQRESKDSQGVSPYNPQPASSSPVAANSASATGSALDWVFCGHCGEKIGAGDVYCAHCGSRQPMAGAQSGFASGPVSRVTAQLVVVGTADMVKPFAIDKESVLIGRTDPHTGIFPEIDLTMYDPETKVSRRHARIYRQGEQFLIEDLGSVNGTVVNSISGGSIRLNTKSPRVLSAGDEVKLGGTTLKFMIM